MRITVQAAKTRGSFSSGGVHPLLALNARLNRTLEGRGMNALVLAQAASRLRGYDQGRVLRITTRVARIINTRSETRGGDR